MASETKEAAEKAASVATTEPQTHIPPGGMHKVVVGHTQAPSALEPPGQTPPQHPPAHEYEFLDADV